MIVYLASPIDHNDRDAGIQQARERVVHHAYNRGHAVFDPSTAWKVGTDATLDATLQEINNQAIKQADLVVALLHPSVLSIGTVLEIQQAVWHRKPVAVVPILAPDQAPRPSWALASLGLSWTPISAVPKFLDGE